MFTFACMPCHVGIAPSIKLEPPFASLGHGRLPYRISRLHLQQPNLSKTVPDTRSVGHTQWAEGRWMWQRGLPRNPSKPIYEGTCGRESVRFIHTQLKLLTILLGYNAQIHERRARAKAHAPTPPPPTHPNYTVLSSTHSSEHQPYNLRESRLLSHFVYEGRKVFTHINAGEHRSPWPGDVGKVPEDFAYTYSNDEDMSTSHYSYVLPDLKTCLPEL
jgi:hypothetical protein